MELTNIKNTGILDVLYILTLFAITIFCTFKIQRTGTKIYEQQIKHSKNTGAKNERR